MRVVHLSLYDRYGGACIAAYRQHEGLRRSGVDSQMWVRFKVTDDPAVHAFTPPLAPWTRGQRVLQRHLLGREHRREVRSGVFIDDRSEYGGSELRGLPAADVINVQSFWNFVHLPALLDRLPPTIPVVFTLHEMAPFTGGCDYARDCKRFEDECGKCPLMGGKRDDDLSRQSWLRKQKVFRQTRSGKVHFVADSHWLAGEACKSSLLRGLPVSVIHYGVDTKVFRPLDRAAARSILRIPADRPVVCFAATFLNDERKGMRQLIEAVQQLAPRPFLLTWGQTQPCGLGELDHAHLGPIINEDFMALAYNAADVFVMPSLQEAFGQTALEATACGVPVVAFEAGGIPDIVADGENGLLAPVGDAQLLGAAIHRVLGENDLARHLGEAGRRRALDKFSMEANAEKYIKLYEALLPPQLSK
jgi:glycosyltransferase involved in cell wall biosynthesis